MNVIKNIAAFILLTAIMAVGVYAFLQPDPISEEIGRRAHRADVEDGYGR